MARLHLARLGGDGILPPLSSEARHRVTTADFLSVVSVPCEVSKTGSVHGSWTFGIPSSGHTLATTGARAYPVLVISSGRWFVPPCQSSGQRTHHTRETWA